MDLTSLNLWLGLAVMIATVGALIYGELRALRTGKGNAIGIASSVFQQLNDSGAAHILNGAVPATDLAAMKTVVDNLSAALEALDTKQSAKIAALQEQLDALLKK